MKRLTLACALACAAASLTGCAPVEITPQDMVGADYGPPITQVEAERLAKAYLDGTLKDPYSAVMACEPVSPGIVKHGPASASGTKIIAGNLMNCTVNAKNAYGGYIGATPYNFLFRSGRLVIVDARESEFGTMQQVYGE